MKNNEVGLGLDQDRLVRRTMAIAGTRDRYFKDLITAVKKRYTTLSIIYANNMPGARIDPMRPNPDFILVLRGTMKSPDPKKPDYSVILVDAPMLFTERTIAGWTLAVEGGQKDAYLTYMMDKAMRITNSKFEDYIEHMCMLSLDPNNALYWRKPENTDVLAKHLGELCARYTPRKPTRIADKRGYTSSQTDK